MAGKRTNADDGAALVGVIALAAVTAIIGATVTAIAVSSMQRTSDVTASVEARAAADAGLVAAELALRLNDCQEQITSTTTPSFTVQVQHTTGDDWVDGCPSDAATLVKLTAVGHPIREAFGPSSVRAEQVFHFLPEYVDIPRVNPAVYAHRIDGTLRRFILDSADNNVAADVQISSGDFVCTNGARVSGSIVLADGSASLTNCTIVGNIHASGAVHLTNSTVTGDIISASDAAPAVRVRGGSTVNGNVYSAGAVQVEDTHTLVSGTITAVADVTVDRSTRVDGNVLTAGNATVTGTVNGTVSTGVGSLQSPPAPEVGSWVDIPYPTSFADSAWARAGYEEISWQGSCTVGNSHAFWDALSSRTTPTVVNALACGAEGITTRNNVRDLTMRTNVAFFAHRFTIDKLVVTPDVSAERGLHFIVPDNVADSQPTCAAPAGGITLTNEADIHPFVRAFAYTPCRIYSDRDGWRGQLFGGQVEFGQQAKLTFVPLTVPGVDLTGGLSPIRESNGGTLGDMQWMRYLTHPEPVR